LYYVLSFAYDEQSCLKHKLLGRGNKTCDVRTHDEFFSL